MVHTSNLADGFVGETERIYREQGSILSSVGDAKSAPEPPVKVSRSL
jgi:hypothetical protein